MKNKAIVAVMGITFLSTVVAYESFGNAPKVFAAVIAAAAAMYAWFFAANRKEQDNE